MKKTLASEVSPQLGICYLTSIKQYKPIGVLTLFWNTLIGCSKFSNQLECSKHGKCNFKNFRWLNSKLSRLVSEVDNGQCGQIWRNFTTLAFFKKIGNIFRVYLVIGIIFNLLWENVFAIDQSFIFVNGQILSNLAIWSHW